MVRGLPGGRPLLPEDLDARPGIFFLSFLFF